MIHHSDHTRIIYIVGPSPRNKVVFCPRLASVNVQTYLWTFMYMFNCVKDVLDMWAKVVLHKHLFHVTLEV